MVRVVAAAALVIGLAWIFRATASAPAARALAEGVGVPPSLPSQLSRPATSPASPVSEARSVPIALLLRQVETLDDEDQRGLDDLYAEARTLLQHDETAMLDTFRRRSAHVQDDSLYSSFFLAKALLKDGNSDTAISVVSRVLDEKSRPLPPPSKPDAPAPKINLLAAFVLRELTTRAPDNAQREKLLPLVVRTAKTEPDMAIVREAMRVVTHLAPNPAAVFAEISAGRVPAERELIAEFSRGD